MVRNYLVYSREGDSIPVISAIELPAFQMRGKLKYVGKKARIEAIYRFSKTRLLPTLTTQHVNDYIAENIFNTPKWNEYHTIFTAVAQEIEVVSEKFEFKYTLIVELTDPAPDLNDIRLIHLLTCELMGQSLTSYNQLTNPIISLRKKY